MEQQNSQEAPPSSPPAGTNRSKDRRVQMVFLVAILLTAGIAYWYQSRPSQVASWPDDALAAIAAAKQDNQNVVLVFLPDIADANSELMAKKTLPAPDVLKVLRETAAHYATVTMNLRNPPALAKEHKVTAVPTELKLSPAGRELKRHVGFIGESDFAKFIVEP